ncbi:MAG: transposase [Nitrososphaerota archaeon]|nr:transposase [Nitrososphaerota archaeon]
MPLFLLELLGLTEFLVVAEECCIEDGVWTIGVTPRFVCLKCHKCASHNVKLLSATYPCNITHVPIGARRTQLRVLVPRIYCRACKRTSSPDVPHTLRHHRVSVDLIDFMLDRFQSRQTYAQIALDTGTSEKSVARVIKEAIQEIDQARTEALVLPAKIGVDDVRFWRGEDGILTHIVDADAGQTLDLIQGTSDEAVQFWFGSAKDVNAVTHYSSDGAYQYIAVGRRNFPTAIRTLNQYHAVGYMLEGLDSIRTAILGDLDAEKFSKQEHTDDSEFETEEEG